jgi:hypothetical protein
MKIGDPIKEQVKLIARSGYFVVTTETLEIRASTRRAAGRLGVTLRRAMAKGPR